MVALKTLMPGVVLSAGAALAAAGIPREGITSTYRDPAEQERIFLARYQKTPCEWAPGKTDRQPYLGVSWYRKPGVSLPAAPPGTSAHEWGEAIDAKVGSPAYVWLSTDGVKRGWYRSRPVSDKVHWQLKKSSSKAAAAAASTVTSEDDVLIYTATSASTSGLIPKGFSFIQGPAGPLRPLSADESDAYTFFSANGIQCRVAEWPGDKIEKLATTVGLMEWNGAPGNAPQLTGRIIRYGKVEAAAAPGGQAQAIDVKAMVAAIVKGVVDGVTAWFKR